MGINYDQGSEFIGHEFRKSLIQKEYGINAKPSTSGNSNSNEILKRIYQVLGNLVKENDQWMGILDAAALVNISTKNRLKVYSPGQLLFGRDTILLIKHNLDWELISQQKQTQINEHNIRKNNKGVDHDYKSGDKVMLTNNSAYKYATPYNGTFVITQCWTNETVTLQCGPIQTRHHIHRIKPYASDTNIKDINTEKYV